jgi:hypothetical protein
VYNISPLKAHTNCSDLKITYIFPQSLFLWFIYYQIKTDGVRGFVIAQWDASVKVNKVSWLALVSWSLKWIRSAFPAKTNLVTKWYWKWPHSSRIYMLYLCIRTQALSLGTCVMFVTFTLSGQFRDGYGLNGSGIKSLCVRVFRIRPDLLSGPHILLHNGYWSSFQR